MDILNPKTPISKGTKAEIRLYSKDLFEEGTGVFFQEVKDLQVDSNTEVICRIKDNSGNQVVLTNIDLLESGLDCIQVKRKFFDVLSIPLEKALLNQESSFVSYEIVLQNPGQSSKLIKEGTLYLKEESFDYDGVFSKNGDEVLDEVEIVDSSLFSEKLVVQDFISEGFSIKEGSFFFNNSNSGLFFLTDGSLDLSDLVGVFYIDKSPCIFRYELNMVRLDSTFQYLEDIGASVPGFVGSHHYYHPFRVQYDEVKRRLYFLSADHFLRCFHVSFSFDISVVFDLGVLGAMGSIEDGLLSYPNDVVFLDEGEFLLSSLKGSYFGTRGGTITKHDSSGNLLDCLFYNDESENLGQVGTIRVKGPLKMELIGCELYVLCNNLSSLLVFDLETNKLIRNLSFILTGSFAIFQDKKILTFCLFDGFVYLVFEEYKSFIVKVDLSTRVAVSSFGFFSEEQKFGGFKEIKSLQIESGELVVFDSYHVSVQKIPLDLFDYQDGIKLIYGPPKQSFGEVVVPLDQKSRMNSLDLTTGESNFSLEDVICVSCPSYVYRNYKI